MNLTFDISTGKVNPSGPFARRVEVVDWLEWFLMKRMCDMGAS
ncbi:MAG: hypothetical protein ACOX51_01705 [Myxococcota bacterium]|nr:hypothetical protein [Myxococcota bacterium]HON24328.1 hypothetical protein [Myxococcota bacterium]HOS60913.1 hypothetical protein [Myxococcota bacterium]HPC90682.1 hypothetical protein [Myxococcota bacterium]HPL24057.1 hypothetical protein [Myxococcota bacterium]